MSQKRHPLTYDRTARLTEPLSRPAWECGEWWQQRARALPARDCGKCVTHGPARVEFSVTRLGRTLAYHCIVCGWMQTVLVQEGARRPEAPTPNESPLPKMAQLGQAGGRAKWRNWCKTHKRYACDHKKRWWN